ncbi:Cysteine desulfurase [Symmachiella dynata]|uniref:cysteine desulfurase n=1 Tax=Symmachiella dynata TaxID=2527995 RepID=A0A517ZID4_9PLAN|nr:cysteine desulfurase family protein [Symmachiella dynata]QDU42231.1 Cysteine desulfurase [Symmachiella dynata]
MTATPIYLDNHATTRVDPRVLDAMLPYFSEIYGNAASISHRFGWDAGDAVEAARGKIAELFNTDARNVIFTSGATEANNLALKGVLHAAPPGSHLITAAAEHKAVLDPAKRLSRSDYEVTVLPVDQYGMVDPQQIAESLRPNTVLVSIMSANNEVGTLNDIAEIAALCRERGVHFHTDAAQSAGKLPLDLSTTPIDLLSLSGHKIYGPKGIGVLFVRHGSPRIKLEPQLDGGGHERHLRSGTLPVPLIVGLGRACELCGETMVDEAARLLELRERLWTGLQDRLDGLTLNGHPEQRLPGNLNVSFDGVEGDALMNSMREIAVSSGSACTSADPQPSHVLRAMGVSDALTRASLRFGLGRFNTTEEIDRAVEVVADAVGRLRE